MRRRPGRGVHLQPRVFRLLRQSLLVPVLFGVVVGLLRRRGFHPAETFAGENLADGRLPQRPGQLRKRDGRIAGYVTRAEVRDGAPGVHVGYAREEFLDQLEQPARIEQESRRVSVILLQQARVVKRGDVARVRPALDGDGHSLHHDPRRGCAAPGRYVPAPSSALGDALLEIPQRHEPVAVSVEHDAVVG